MRGELVQGTGNPKNFGKKSPHEAGLVVLGKT
jgi:hypothetical protein